MQGRSPATHPAKYLTYKLNRGMASLGAAHLASSASSSSSSRVRCCEDELGRPRGRTQRACEGLFPEKSFMHVAPPRPRRIILVRHGQSEGNVDESVYTRVPDPRIGLTPRGWEDAEACGRRIRDLVSYGADDWKVYFYVSPYRRTLETLRGLGRAFERERIVGIREEPRLREQDFGRSSSLPPPLPPPPPPPLLLLR